MAAYLLGTSGTPGVDADPMDPALLRAYYPSRLRALEASTRVRAKLAAWAGEGLGAAAEATVRHWRVLRLGTAWERQWLRAWARTLTPVRVGDVVISATRAGRGGRTRARPARALRVVIPPGTAFGTGHHPTTVQALWALQLELAAGHSHAWGPGPVVDVGTGSGILAIAARRLGAFPIVAVDTDPEAVATARANCRRNDVSGIRVLLGSAARAIDDLGQARARVVVANLLAGLLVELAPQLARLVARGGTVIGAGIAADEISRVVGAFQDAGLVTEAWGAWSGWAWVVASRPEPPAGQGPCEARPPRSRPAPTGALQKTGG